MRWIVWLATAFCATSGAAWTRADPVAAIDASGATIELPAPARRIVSLAPHATELLFAAGAGHAIVGVLSPADAPPEAARLPRVGDSHALDLERIIALKPDLVVAWPYLAPTQVERLRGLGLPVYLSDPRSPAAIADEIDQLGVLTGQTRTASRAASALRARIAALQERQRDVRRIRVFYEIWNQPLFTVGGGHLISAAIELCGGTNIFASLTLAAPQVSVEAVLEAAPEAIVAGGDGPVPPAWLDTWRSWRELPAVTRGSLYAIDANLLHRAGPRFVEGLERLCVVLDDARMRLRR
ncbi:MAG: cobalamin-binding protein [Betaproteobacteria bacterium]|nr:MAG: cobalamin-binding protein [Betaproteobacteria bacterium]